MHIIMENRPIFGYTQRFILLQRDEEGQHMRCLFILVNHSVIEHGLRACGSLLMMSFASCYS